MGPRQSLPIDSSSGSDSRTRGVRTGVTNSALVRNFDHLFGSHLAGDGADGGAAAAAAGTPSRSPRTSIGLPSTGTDSAPLSTGSSSGSLGKATVDGNDSSSSSSQQPPQQVQQHGAAGASKAQQLPPQPETTPLCVRYKFQPPRSSGSHAPQPQPQQKQVPLPPAPREVFVDLYDGDGRPIKALRLNRSEGEFFAVVPVQMPSSGRDEKPLMQYFRFRADNQPPGCHPHLPQCALPGGAPGEMVNYVSVESPEMELRRAEKKQPPAVGKDGAIVGGAPAAAEDDSGWSQNPPQFEETRKFPPMMPPHLRYTPLNAPPSQFRCDQDGNVVPVTDEGAAVGPEHRPAPLSVTINHMYFQRREDHTLVGITARFRDKATSISYYRHDPVPIGAVPMHAMPMPMPRRD